MFEIISVENVIKNKGIQLKAKKKIIQWLYLSLPLTSFILSIWHGWSFSFLKLSSVNFHESIFIYFSYFFGYSFVYLISFFSSLQPLKLGVTLVPCSFLSTLIPYVISSSLMDLCYDGSQIHISGPLFQTPHPCIQLSTQHPLEWSIGISN